MTNAVPPEIQRLVDALGERVTLLLIELHGGTRLYFATGDRGDPLLERQIGKPAAQVLAGMFGRERFLVPLAKEWRGRLYRAEGMSYSQIARRLGVTEKTVQRWCVGVEMSAPVGPAGNPTICSG